ncbi:MAG: SDR family NAD(P)-dependent oxidoreductase [Pseudomonadales bacterium]|nr:SDR family NAD(P)-dependent oxidoreductase [Pseudomonadales bacterium]
MQEVEGKVAFITGAASGMGLGMARAFSRAGMSVMLADIDAEKLAAVEAELKAAGAEVASIRCDVTEEQSVFAAAEETIKVFGKVNVLCNNAGVSVGGLTEELSQKDWDWVQAVNQQGVIYGLRAFLPKIKATGEAGHVMSTSSMAGLINAGPGWGPYNATKFAVVGIMEVLYSELKDFPIGVSVLCPGGVNTNIFDAAKHRPEKYGELDDRPIALNDIGDTLKFGLDPDVVGELVLAGIRQDQFYIFTDPRARIWVEKRFDRIMQGFNWSRDCEVLIAADAPGTVWKTKS